MPRRIVGGLRPGRRGKLEAVKLVYAKSLWWIPIYFQDCLKIFRRSFKEFQQVCWTFRKKGARERDGSTVRFLIKVEKSKRDKKRAGVRVIFGFGAIWKKHHFSQGRGMKLKTLKASFQKQIQLFWTQSWKQIVLAQKYREIKRLAVFSCRNKSEHFGDFGVDATLCAVPQ